MKKTGKGRIWWWILLVLILVGLLGYFFRTEIGHHNAEKTPVSEDRSDAQKAETPLEGKPGLGGEEAPLEQSKVQGAITQNLAPEELCKKTQQEMADFFLYLDGKRYFKELAPRQGSRERFKEILREMAAHPPIPAGEGSAPESIAETVFHFFRILNRSDLRLIREVISHEDDALEIDLEMFHRWVTLGDHCPDPNHLRPSLDVLYQYAGFFLNTIGGRAYLFRRSPGLRLLVSYYCLLILHEADKKGKNNYGIDIRALIPPLRKEMSYYPNFQFRDEYVRHLDEIEGEYSQRR